MKVREGRVVCPVCGQLSTQRVTPRTRLENAPIYCKHCKTTSIVDIIPESQCHSASAE